MILWKSENIIGRKTTIDEKKVAMTIIMLEEIFNKGFGKLKDVAFYS